MNIRLSSPYSQETGEIPQGSPIPGLPFQKFADLAAQICVFVLHRPSEGVHSSISSAAGIWGGWGVSYGPMEDQFAGEIAATRGQLVKGFRRVCEQTDQRADEQGRPRLKYLVMIDNDEVVHELVPLNLAFWDLPVVSGVVCNTSEHGVIKMCFTVKDVNGKPRFPTLGYTKRVPAKGLIEVHSVGAGALCVRRDVFDTLIDNGEVPFHIPESDRLECWRTGTMRVGEDIVFCRQLDKYDIKKYVDFSVRLPHMKTVPIIWPSWDPKTQSGIDPDMDVRDFRVDSNDYAHGD